MNINKGKLSKNKVKIILDIFIYRCYNCSVGNK